MSHKPAVSVQENFIDTPSKVSNRLVTISVDAMGGDKGPEAVVGGISLSFKKFKGNRDKIRFLLHGKADIITSILKHYPELEGVVDIRDAERVVTMNDKPSHIMRHGNGTSMWEAVDSVKNGEAQAVVSCGNTGALMAVAMVRLRRIPGINRPAIAGLWPSLNPSGANIILDIGAGIEADPQDLFQFAIMGASYAQSALSLAKPRVGLLNVGTEEHKGHISLKLASELIESHAEAMAYDFVGFVEGTDIPTAQVDVIVTDGFTGNIALKTGEGTAKFMSGVLQKTFKRSLLSKFVSFLSLNVLKSIKRQLDPRRLNGGVFLGVNGTVIKSHGSSDPTGVAAAVNLAIKLTLREHNDQLLARIVSAVPQKAEHKSDNDHQQQTPQKNV